MICLIDNSEHATREDLHKHLRKLKVKQEDYYTQWEPRRDLCTGEPIPYKAPSDRYLTLEFASKDNLRKWIKENSPEARAWAIEFLRKRKVEKSLTYPPTQVELRSMMCPSAHYYDFVGSYNAICCDLGYDVRFAGAISDAPLPKGAVVLVDTREQDPLKLSCAHRVETVKCGDYALAFPHDQSVYVERKSLQDLMGTVSDRRIDRGGAQDSNLARFRRELERANETGSYIVMLVEKPIDYVLEFEPEHGAMNPEHLFHNLRGLLQVHHNFQVLFVKDRDEAARAVPRLLAMGESIRHVDLQLQYEAKRLTF